MGETAANFNYWPFSTAWQGLNSTQLNSTLRNSPWFVFVFFAVFHKAKVVDSTWYLLLFFWCHKTLKWRKLLTGWRESSPSLRHHYTPWGILNVEIPQP